MEIKTEYLNLKINGEDNKLALLTYKGAEKILTRLSEVDQNDGIAILKVKGETLMEAGLSQEALEKLQMKHMNQVFDALVGLKND